MRVIKQIKNLLLEMDALREKVREEDLERFDDLMKPGRDTAFAGMKEFAGKFEMPSKFFRLYQHTYCIFRAPTQITHLHFEFSVRRRSGQSATGGGYEQSTRTPPHAPAATQFPAGGTPIGAEASLPGSDGEPATGDLRSARDVPGNASTDCRAISGGGKDSRQCGGSSGECPAGRIESAPGAHLQEGHVPRSRSSSGHLCGRTHWSGGGHESWRIGGSRMWHPRLHRWLCAKGQSQCNAWQHRGGAGGTG